ncbi:hypothetical protein [Leptolyngbya ohadii]|uniref:hypothetical protein n=1 Tax=Leptolyngbya ohadii TaxID=1962290 RepID=UPI00117AB53D|nr:hypothetical protein [Leptolyngbya ohadii]
MEEDVLGESVAQKGRIPVDINDMREEIEECRDDAAWRELPLSSKIRVLIRERLDQIKEESKARSN